MFHGFYVTAGMVHKYHDSRFGHDCTFIMHQDENVQRKFNKARTMLSLPLYMHRMTGAGMQPECMRAVLITTGDQPRHQPRDAAPLPVRLRRDAPQDQENQGHDQVNHNNRPRTQNQTLTMQPNTTHAQRNST